MLDVCGSCKQPKPKKNKKAEREADRAALEGIVNQTVDYALSLRESGRDEFISQNINIAMDAEGEGLADRLGHGFERADIDGWETVCRAAYAQRLASLTA